MSMSMQGGLKMIQIQKETNVDEDKFVENRFYVLYDPKGTNTKRLRKVFGDDIHVTVLVKDELPEFVNEHYLSEFVKNILYKVPPFANIFLSGRMEFIMFFVNEIISRDFVMNYVHRNQKNGKYSIWSMSSNFGAQYM